MPEDLVGRSIDTYRIVSRLGAGGMGEVFLAHDSALDRPVALKLLPADIAADPDRLRRFHQEARAASSLNHPHILVIHQFGEIERRPYIVTEFVEGETLRHRLRSGVLGARTAVEIGVQVASALAAAHARGIVHRDIKPENIMVRPDGYVKVLDFGLAKVRSARRSGRDSGPDAVTEPGVMLGTPRYMAPEQIRGADVDARADVWSIGVVIYEMLAGRPPFDGPTIADVMAAILRSDAIPVEIAAPQVPAALARLVARTLEKDPDDRLASSGELLAELVAIKATLDSSPPRDRSVDSPAPARRTRTRKAAAIDSLAVLPFVNGSGDPEADYFCDGVTDHIIETLSRVPRLKVMSWSMIARYKRKEVDPIDLGRALNVRAVLTGRVVQHGEHLTINVELVDVDEGWRLWGEHYDRHLADIFSLEATIATEISDKLRLQLTGREKKALTRTFTRNVAAYQAYLRGRYCWNKRVQPKVQQAMRHFEEAIAADPAYALAYTGIADCYAILGMTEYGSAPPREAMPRSKAAALKALEIDDRLAEAHASLAHVLAFYEWRWEDAEREFRRAIELDPQYVFAHAWYALFLAAMRRFDEAIAAQERALALDPLSLIMSKNLGEMFYYARQHDRAIDQYRKTAELDAGFARTSLFTAMAYLAMSNPNRAVDELQTGLRLAPGDTIMEGVLGCALARAGRRSDARDVLQTLETRAATQYVPPFTLAMIHIGLDRPDPAFEWLERAFDERSSWLASLNIEPLLDPIRGDPRFAPLVRRVGLP